MSKPVRSFENFFSESDMRMLEAESKPSQKRSTLSRQESKNDFGVKGLNKEPSRKSLSGQKPQAQDS